MSKGNRCCKRAGQRFYYLVMAVFYGITMAIELVTLGLFGVKFSQLRSHFNGNVCILYADISGNPDNNASCGFTLWGLVTVVLVLLVWMIFHIIMAIIGRPKITSLARVIDLIMASLMHLLSLILSSVLTRGLRITCRRTGSRTTSHCRDHFFENDSGKRLSFFGNLNAAKDTSWTVTTLLAILICWYVTSLIMHCCIKKFRKDEEEENVEKDGKKEDKKDEKEEPPDFPAGDGSPEENDVEVTEDSANLVQDSK